MLGPEAPDLDETPCVACGERVLAAEVVWDAWHTGDSRLAALPYHRRCAGEVLPPVEPSDSMRACGRCGEALTPAVLSAALAALHQRFEAAKGSLVSPEVVWRLKERHPRLYVPEHFACVLAAATRRGRPQSEPQEPKETEPQEPPEEITGSLGPA
jgi:hypothetical protein